MTLNREKLENHISHLQELHAILDKEIDNKTRSGLFEDQEIEELKKKRLNIKDQITRFQREARGHE
jgi:hypothetical protein